MSHDLIQEFEQLVGEARAAESAVARAPDVAALEILETEFLGRRGKLAGVMAGMKDVAAADRPGVGAAANDAKQKLTEIFAARRVELEHAALAAIAETEWVDVTEPGAIDGGRAGGAITAAAHTMGTLHVTSQAIDEITEIFAHLGFTRARYPEIDWDWFAFEALNMPPSHPARDEWETFFVDAPGSAQFGKMVLTPHTSNGQIHEMKTHRPPIRMINIAKCYRRQSDVSHVPMFHQFEGLVVDRDISVAHLKGTLEYFARRWFGPERRIRLRPFHFRFTEPSFEIDVSCDLCHGTGRAVGSADAPSDVACRLCKQGWLELGGAGMVHPNVLRACGVDAREFSGFAFGWGVERTLMMRAGLKIPDVRELYKNDLRFLKQF